MSPRRSGTTNEDAKTQHSQAYQSFVNGMSIMDVSLNYGLHIRYLRTILRAERAIDNANFEMRLKK